MSYIPTGAARNYLPRAVTRTTKGLTTLSTSTMGTLSGSNIILGVGVRTTTTIVGGACAVSIDITVASTTANIAVMYHDGANTVWDLGVLPLPHSGTGTTAGDTLWYPLGVPVEAGATIAATTSGTAASSGAIEVTIYYANVV